MSKPRIIPVWTLNVAKLRAELAAVRAHCSTCTYSVEVDLEVVAAKHGEMFCFWNRHPPCPERTADKRRCAGRLSFAAQRADSGVWPHLMKTDYPGDHDLAHAAWQADREAVRRADRLWRFMRKRQLHRARVRTEAARLMLLPRDVNQESADLLLWAQPHERDFWAEVRLEVLRRRARGAEVDLEAEVDVRRRPESL